MLDHYDDAEKIELTCTLLELVIGLIEDQSIGQERSAVEIHLSHLEYWTRTLNVCFEALEPMIETAREKREVAQLVAKANIAEVADRIRNSGIAPEPSQAVRAMMVGEPTSAVHLGQGDRP